MLVGCTAQVYVVFALVPVVCWMMGLIMHYGKCIKAEKTVENCETIVGVILAIPFIGTVIWLITASLGECWRAVCIANHSGGGYDRCL